MNYAIIAAGEGSRLLEEGVTTPKPLVSLNGEKMIDRLIRIFIANNAESIYIIINEQMKQVQDYLLHKQWEVPVHILVQSTPSSMHSFYALSSRMPRGKFCLTTVDTIFREEEFGPYIAAFESENEADGLFAVTDYIEDESPLYVDVDSNLKIQNFIDQKYNGCRYISGGIYCLTSTSIPVLHHAIERGEARMRNFQRALIRDGLNLKAYPFSKIIDVDHASDIQVAESFISSEH